MDLLERAAEIDALKALLRRVATAGGSLVLLGGEAGVGKTALVRHLCDRARATARILVGACDALSTPRPLGPLLDIAAAGSELARLVAADAPRPALFRAALDVLTAEVPTLFVVEDAHWADEATLDLLRFLGRRIQATRSLLLVTYRDDEVGPGHPLRVVTGDLATAAAVHRIGLAPLSPTAVATLAATGGLDPVALHRRTGGNLFFVTEVLAAGGHGISATVHDAVLARAARLSPAARSILEAAAVIGARVEPPLLDAIGGPDADAVDQCLARGMLRTEQDVLTFRHELARDAVLAAIPQRRRRRLHAAVLAALQADPVGDDDLAPGVTAEVFAGAPSTRAPGQTVYLARFVFRPGGEISAHSHPGTTVLGVASGSFGWTLVEGTARVVRGAAAGATGPTEDLTEPGADVILEPGDAIFYEDDVVHTARGAGGGGGGLRHPGAHQRGAALDAGRDGHERHPGGVDGGLEEMVHGRTAGWPLGSGGRHRAGCDAPRQFARCGQGNTGAGSGQ